MDGENKGMATVIRNDARYQAKVLSFSPSNISSWLLHLSWGDPLTKIVESALNTAGFG